MSDRQRLDNELAAWSVRKIEQAQAARVYGEVTFFMEEGVITRCEVKTTDKPNRPKHVKSA